MTPIDRSQQTRRVRRNRRYTFVGLMALLLLNPSTPYAHPHYWIDVFAEWQFNQEGLVHGVKIRWLFDDYYSVLLVNDAAKTGEELQEMLDEILVNTAQQDYFINIEHLGVRAEPAPAEQPRIDVQDHRIQIEFLLALPAPLDLAQGDLVYRVAEPTYFFEMLHAQEARAILLKNAPQACGYHIDAPQPDAALVAYASSLDITENGENDLGILFAETVTIRCE